MTLRAIYRPKGEALEYAPLGLNLFAGCSHGCRYCYNKDRFTKACTAQLKKSTLENIRTDLEELAAAGNKDPVHLCFVGDAYDLGRQDNSYVRKVLRLFRIYDHPFQVLTKGGLLAARDFDLYGPADRFGVTLTFVNPEDSKKWEPGAALPADRIEALRQAHSQGITTWASLEPVIDPAQTLWLLELTYPFVDHYGVGKLNHCPEVERAIDWRKFRADAEALLQKHGKSYAVKAALQNA